MGRVWSYHVRWDQEGQSFMTVQNAFTLTFSFDRWRNWNPGTWGDWLRSCRSSVVMLHVPHCQTRRQAYLWMSDGYLSIRQTFSSMGITWGSCETSTLWFSRSGVGPTILHSTHSPGMPQLWAWVYNIPEPNFLSWFTWAAPQMCSTSVTFRIAAFFFPPKQKRSERSLCVSVHPRPLFWVSPTMCVFFASSFILCVFLFWPFLSSILLFLFIFFFPR